ncbi:hypothetical protein ACT17_23345 [Mycolicibacterium conceptionense]|uniref:Uncharacterized protein n=1 Tax=Mycolicibacterium conceptionense TaxID=451644 RepID=A0A0J8U2V7_9MYCO|nr:hypothetical protein [Mycolicibacterium conceptionense]KMV15831.1 hypothetical protein ACT17_23345 [Mycolicibacterium conceptionense]
MRVEINSDYGPPFVIADRSDGSIRLSRNVAGDGKRIALFMDSVVARLIADGLHDIADSLDDANHEGEE